MRVHRIAILIMLGGLPAWAESPANITGDYVEARSNHVYTCGCQYSGEQVTAGREAILAWNIKTGVHRGASLAGIRIVAVVVGEGNLGAGAMPRRSALYLSGTVSAEQRRAVVDLLFLRYGAVLGDLAAVHGAPITFLREGEKTTVATDGVRLVLRQARLPVDAHAGSSQWYEPFIPVTDPLLGATSDYEYQGTDLGRKWWEREAGITGYFGRFVLEPAVS